jgi:transposase
MIQKSGTEKRPAEAVIKDIRLATRKQYGAEEKIRIVLEGLRGEEPIAALCRREGIAESLYYNWSKEVLEASRFATLFLSGKGVKKDVKRARSLLGPRQRSGISSPREH